ncbi:MAG: ABC transporter permease [Christensenellales bacterium]|jgi:lipopolysaccharide transport system permease protein
MHWIKTRLQSFFQYWELLVQLVKRDIKIKYRRSILGYLWSVLNPLLIMLVMTAVFSQLFNLRAPNYPVYFLTGQVMFNFMSEATTMASNSIVLNASLLKKTYVPKYIFPVAKVSSSLVNMLFSLGALWIVMAITGIKLTWWFLLFPIVILELYIFSLGLGMFLAQAMVFFRDVQYLYGVAVTVWMYLTPIIYTKDILPAWLQNVLYWNPMYYYVEQFRGTMLYGQMPEPYLVLGGIGFALAFLLFGLWTFRRSQHKFILYI